MLKFDDIKKKAVETCQQGMSVLENSFVRRHRIPGGAALVRDCARAMAELFNADGYAVQSFEVADEDAPGVFVQIGRKPEGWKRKIAVVAGGQDLAVCVKFVDKESDAEIEIGGGRWIDKMFSGVVTWSLFAPLLAIPAIGIFRQRWLIREVEAEICAWFANNRNRLGAIDV